MAFYIYSTAQTAFSDSSINLLSSYNEHLSLGSFSLFHHHSKLIKQWRTVVRARAGFWVTLEAKDGLIGQLNTLIGTIK